jgi:hypothetical protein
VAAVTLSLFLSGLILVPGVRRQRADATAESFLLIALVLTLFTCILRWQNTSDSKLRNRIIAFTCALVLFDLVATGSQTRPNTGTGDPGLTPPPGVQFVTNKVSSNLYRADTTQAPTGWNTMSALWSLSSANGMDPFLLDDTVRYRSPFSQLKGRQFTLIRTDSPLFDLAGIRYVISLNPEVPGLTKVFNGFGHVFENPRALPRFFLVGAVSFAKDPAEAINAIDNHKIDPSRVAIIATSDIASSDTSAFNGLQVPAASGELGEVRLLDYSPNTIDLQVQASRPAVLVATETFWKDWQGYVDGHPQPIVRADGLFRAMLVPAGSHSIRMHIVPRALYRGAILSVFSLLLTALLLAVPSSHQETAKRSASY